MTLNSGIGVLYKMRYNRINKRSKCSKRQMSLSDGVFFRKVNYKIYGQVIYGVVYVSNRYKKEFLHRDGLRYYTIRRIQKILEGK